MRAQFRDCCPHPVPATSPRWFIYVFDHLVLNWGSHSFLFGLSLFDRRVNRTQRNTPNVYQFMIKVLQMIPMMTRWGDVWRKEPKTSMLFPGVTMYSAILVCAPWRLNYIGMIDETIGHWWPKPPPAPLPFLETEVWGWLSNPLNLPWSFMWPALTGKLLEGWWPSLS